MSSKIPVVRAEILALDLHRLNQMSRAEIRRAMLAWLPMLTRASPHGRATPVRVKKTPNLVKRVIRDAKNSQLTQTEIAVRNGLRNNGRVSEILAAAHVERSLCA
jgi:hypothetical protein